MDPGWLQTAESYYTNSVKEILTSITVYLTDNPTKTFSQADIWFFQKWWLEQTP